MRSFQHTDKRTWSLLDDQGAVLGSLVRTKWHGMGAEIVLAQGVYEVKGMKGFTSKTAVFSGDLPLRVASYGWKGITIKDPQGVMPVVTVRREHLFSGTYVINASDRGQMKMRLRMNWKRFDTEPEFISATGEELDPLTVLLALHAIRVQQQRAAGAAA